MDDSPSRAYDGGSSTRATCLPFRIANHLGNSSESDPRAASPAVRNTRVFGQAQFARGT